MYTFVRNPEEAKAIRERALAAFAFGDLSDRSPHPFVAPSQRWLKDHHVHALAEYRWGELEDQTWIEGVIEAFANQGATGLLIWDPTPMVDERVQEADGLSTWQCELDTNSVLQLASEASTWDYVLMPKEDLPCWVASKYVWEITTYAGPLEFLTLGCGGDVLEAAQIFDNGWIHDASPENLARNPWVYEIHSWLGRGPAEATR